MCFCFSAWNLPFPFILTWVPWTKHIEIKTRQMIQLIFLKSKIKKQHFKHFGGPNHIEENRIWCEPFNNCASYSLCCRSSIVGAAIHVNSTNREKLFKEKFTAFKKKSNQSQICSFRVHFSDSKNEESQSEIEHFWGERECSFLFCTRAEIAKTKIKLWIWRKMRIECSDVSGFLF